MRYTPTTLGLALLLVLLSCSKPGGDGELAADSTAVDSLAYPEPDGGDTEASISAEQDVNEIVDYFISKDEEVEEELATFKPLDELLGAARKAVSFKDSVIMANAPQDVVDTSIYESRVKPTYEMILTYKQSIKAGIKTERVPKLTNINRIPEANDKTSNFLPAAGKSGFVSNGDFFFLGGAPFIQKYSDVFSGPGGKPESRYWTSITENADYFFNSVYNHVGGPVDITFGPELNTFDGSISIRGIGSLIHTFTRRIPVYFITEQGAVSAQLISVTIKLAPQGMGCVSDNPFYEFASAEDIDPTDILFVYVPYSGQDMKVSAAREGRALWTADLNGDGVADFACVSGTFVGIADDTLNEVLWFANIDGEWKIIDFGTDPDCT